MGKGGASQDGDLHWAPGPKQECLDILLRKILLEVFSVMSSPLM